MSMIAVNNMSDIFIYYMATIYQETNEHQFSLLAFLWLTLLKELLKFAEKGHSKELHGLVVCTHDNIKRVMEFLIQQNILYDPSTSVEVANAEEMGKLWRKSWESISAFF